MSKSLTSELETLISDNWLGKREIEILSVLLAHLDGVTWKDFEPLLSERKMSKRTLSKGLTELVNLGIITKNKEQWKGRVTKVYRFSSPEIMNLFGLIQDQISAIIRDPIFLISSWRGDIVKPNLRHKSLSTTIEKMFDLQEKLIIMGIKLTLRSPDVITGQYRLHKLLTFFSNNVVNVIWNVCWNNHDVIGSVLNEMMMPSLSELRAPFPKYKCPCCRLLTMYGGKEIEKCFLCQWVTGGKYDTMTGEIYGHGDDDENYPLEISRYLFWKHLVMYSPDDQRFPIHQEEKIIELKKTIIKHIQELEFSTNEKDIKEIIKIIEVEKEKLENLLSK